MLSSLSEPYPSNVNVASEGRFLTARDVIVDGSLMDASNDDSGSDMFVIFVPVMSIDSKRASAE